MVGKKVDEKSQNQQNHRLHRPVLRFLALVQGLSLPHAGRPGERQKPRADRSGGHSLHRRHGVDVYEGQMPALRTTFTSQTVQYRLLPTLR